MKEKQDQAGDDCQQDRAHPAPIAKYSQQIPEGLL